MVTDRPIHTCLRRYTDLPTSRHRILLDPAVIMSLCTFIITGRHHCHREGVEVLRSASLYVCMSLRTHIPETTKFSLRITYLSTTSRFYTAEHMKIASHSSNGVWLWKRTALSVVIRLRAAALRFRLFSSVTLIEILDMFPHLWLAHWVKTAVLDCLALRWNC